MIEYKKIFISNTISMEPDQEQHNKIKFRIRIGKYLKALIAFAAIVLIILIASGIWHSIYASLLSGEFFKKIGGSSPRNVAISIAVLSFGSIVVVGLLLVFPDK